MNKLFKRSQKAWNSFLKPTIIILATVIGMVVGAKNKYPQVAHATTKILKSISDGNFLSITNMRCHGLGLIVM